MLESLLCVFVGMYGLFRIGTGHIRFLHYTIFYTQRKAEFIAIIVTCFCIVTTLY